MVVVDKGLFVDDVDLMFPANATYAAHDLLCNDCQPYKQATDIHHRICSV